MLTDIISRRMYLPGQLLALPVLVFLLAGCSGMLFQPYKTLVRTPADVGLEYVDVDLRATDGVLLHGWWLKAEGEARGSVYFLHGNAENISTHLASVYWLPAAGYQVLLLDYRGFGQSRGSPNIPAVFLDIEAGFDWLLRQSATRDKPIFLFGQSIGAALGCYMAATDPAMRRHLDGVILESSFSSYRAITREVASQYWLTWALQWPVAWSMPGKYDPLDYIGAISPRPLLLLHGSRDEVVPMSQAEKLYAAARQPKQFLKYDGPHIGAMAQPWLRSAMLEFMQKSHPDLKQVTAHK